MKDLLKILSLFAVLGTLTFLSSCGDDDGGGIGPGDDDDDDRLLVANGFYPSAVGGEPSAVQQLTGVAVDGPDFGTLDRDGFIQAYVYLTAGDYNLVEVADGAIVNTYGGTATTVEGESTGNGDAVDRNMECDTENSSFTLVDAAVDGAAFNIPADGLYVIAYDSDTGEIVYDQITSAGVIGGATPGGWGTDTEMTGTVTAVGGSWEVTGMALEAGEWKIRFNCRWAIDRRLDATMGFANDNGYSFFTNFGGVDGNPANLAPGNVGSNFNNADRGVYTVTLNWDPITGFSATPTKTGDLEPLPEFPESLYLIGDALNMADTDSDGTPDGWQWDFMDIPLIPVNSNPHLLWRIVWLEAGGGFKLAPGREWVQDFGKDGDATNGVYAKGSENIPAPETSGYYIVVVNSADPDNTTIEVNAATVYGIGDAFGSWDEATHAFTQDTENKTLVSPALTAASADIRIYTTASTFTPLEAGGNAVAWWQAEFIILNGEIAYRGNGGDQDRVQGAVGDVVTLDFVNGTGTIGQ